MSYRLRILAIFLFTTFYCSFGFSQWGEVPPSQMKGAYFSLNVSGVSFKSSQSMGTVLLGGNAVNSQYVFNSANSLNFGWGASLGWQFDEMFRMDLAYFFIDCLMRALSLV